MIPERTSGAKLSRVWWVFAVRGILGLLLGVFAIVAPGATLGAVVIFLAAFFIADGAFAIGKAVQLRASVRNTWALGLTGALGVVLGIVMLVLPGITLLGLAYVIAAWAIVTGGLELYAALSLRKMASTTWLYAIFGIISLVFGVYVALFPAVGLVYLVWMVAFYGFLTGITMLGAAYQVYRHKAS